MSPVWFFFRYSGGISQKFYENCCKAPTMIFFFPECFCLISYAVQLLIVGLPLFNNIYQEMEKVPHCAGLTGISKENIMGGPWVNSKDNRKHVSYQVFLKTAKNSVLPIGKISQ